MLRHHPRITQPHPDLPDPIREVMLAASRWGGMTAFVTHQHAGTRIATIPLIGCRSECEAWLRESLREDHGFEATAAERIARRLFAELHGEAPDLRERDDQPA